MSQEVLGVVGERVAARGARGIRGRALDHVPVRIVAVVKAANLRDGVESNSRPVTAIQRSWFSFL